MHSISVAALRSFAKEAKVTLGPGQPMLFGSNKPAALPRKPSVVAATPKKPGDVSRGALSLGAQVPSQPIPFHAPGAPLDFSGKTAQSALFNELFKIAMNLPPMHPRGAGTGSVSGTLPSKPRPAQAKSTTPITDSVTHAPSGQASAGMLPRFPGVKEAFYDELAKIGANAMSMPARPASAAMSTPVRRPVPVQSMKAYTPPGQTGSPVPGQGDHRTARAPAPRDPSNAPHREMGAIHRKSPYKPQIVQEKDPFGPGVPPTVNMEQAPATERSPNTLRIPGMGKAASVYRMRAFRDEFSKIGAGTTPPPAYNPKARMLSSAGINANTPAPAPAAPPRNLTQMPSSHPPDMSHPSTQAALAKARSGGFPGMRMGR